jgi:hypothetical protein
MEQICGPHFRRTGRKVPAKHKVSDEWMCDACFTGKAILAPAENPQGERLSPGVGETRQDGQQFRRIGRRRTISSGHEQRGQKAMVYAMIHPEGSKGGRGKRNLDETSTFSNKRLQIARRVLRLSRQFKVPKLAEQVRDGELSLNAAFGTVKELEANAGKTLDGFREVAPNATLRGGRRVLSGWTGERSAGLAPGGCNKTAKL